MALTAGRLLAAEIDVGDDQRQDERERHFQEAGKVIVVRVSAEGAGDSSALGRPEYGEGAGAELGEADDGLDYCEADEQVDQLPELRFAGGDGCQKTATGTRRTSRADSVASGISERVR